MRGAKTYEPSNKGSNKNPRMNKKGISPLIATVLLLAFAVALGTMAVSYVLDSSQARGCVKTELQIDPAGTCWQNNRASMVIMNKGEEEINTLLIKFISPAGEIEERRVALALAAGGATKVDVEYKTLDPSNIRAAFVPAIRDGQSDRFCEEKEVIAQIKLCE